MTKHNRINSLICMKGEIVLFITWLQLPLLMLYNVNNLGK